MNCGRAFFVKVTASIKNVALPKMLFLEGYGTLITHVLAFSPSSMDNYFTTTPMRITFECIVGYA